MSVPGAISVAEYLQALAQPSTSKYLARPTFVDGIRFASKREAARYGELRLLLAAGEIHDLVLQPGFALYAPELRVPLDQERPPLALALCEGRYGPQCWARRIGVWYGDFAYNTQDGRAVIEDVKSPATAHTAVYRLKKKMVEAMYDVKIEEVE